MLRKIIKLCETLLEVKRVISDAYGKKTEEYAYCPVYDPEFGCDDGEVIIDYDS